MDEAKEVIKNTLKDERMRGKPLLLLANKQDQGALDPEQLIDRLALQELLNEVRGDMRLPPTRVVSSRLVSLWQPYGSGWGSVIESGRGNLILLIPA